METGQIPKTEEEKKKLLSELFRLLVGRACDDTFTESYRLYSQIKEELDKR